MKRRTRSTHELTKAEGRFSELLDELKMLTLAFPHFKEAYDKDDLPIPFLLKRGAARAKTRARLAKSAKKAAAVTKTKLTKKAKKTKP